MPITFKQLGNKGRRGNMLFQASATISLALRNNDDYIFPHCDIEHDFNIPKSKFVPRNKIIPKFMHNEIGFHYTPIQYKPNLDLDCPPILCTLDLLMVLIL